MRAKARSAGFVLAQPEGGLPANAWDTLSGSGDVDFIVALVDDVADRVPINRNRVFAGGFSAGGGMANRLACDAADVFAAVLVVGGAHFGHSRCEPAVAVPILAIYGDADIVVPYEGIGLLPDIEEWAEAWADRNGCAGTPVQSPVGNDVTRSEWTGCRDGSATLLYTVDGGEHSWPGTANADRLAETTDTISATDLAWDFFVAHPVPGA
jgi:polyhydroxybutyrate depolymerase